MSKDDNEMHRIQKPCACKQHYETVAYFLINIFSPIKQTKALRMIVMCKWLKWKAADATRKKKNAFLDEISLAHARCGSLPVELVSSAFPRNVVKDYCWVVVLLHFVFEGPTVLYYPRYKFMSLARSSMIQLKAELCAVEILLSFVE